MILLVIVYTIADFLVTAINMNHSSFYELNPIARYIINNYGTLGLALFKIGTTAPLVIIYALYATQLSQWVVTFFKISVWLLILFWSVCWGYFLWENL